MDIKKIFEIYTGLYAVQLATFSNSFAHDNYVITSNLAEDYIMSVPYNKVNLKSLFNQEFKVINLLSKKKIDTSTIFFDKDSGIRISKYIGDVSSQKDLVENYIPFIKCLRTFHKLECHNTGINEFSPIQYYEYIKEKVEKINLDKKIEESILEKAKIAYEKCEEKVLCHNNLSMHNIIKHNDEYVFTGLALVGLSDPLYDFANFFFKSKITNKPIVEKFLKRYFGNSYTDDHYDYLRAYLNLAILIYAVWNQYLAEVNETTYEKDKSEKLYNQLKDYRY